MRPKVILNCAASADGKIALSNRQRLKLSNNEDFERVHQLRSKYDAILVGIGTIIADDPSLTVDPKYNSTQNPIRIVLDTKCRTPRNSKILDGKSKTILAIGEGTEPAPIQNAEIIKCGTDEINLPKLLKELSNKGVKTILVEGGETVMWSFLKNELFDEFNIFISSMIIGGEMTPTIAGGEGTLESDDLLRLKLDDAKTLGNGILLTYSKSNN
uniref:2,5-diamino-6-(ribosylamino)-4(3H)-pyrimidinone 5'-phosphate reductase n=1 Tax=uncultured marine group II/III euryarchaeote AD1000_99_D12 TaxID=1457831 RepID=A0A075G6U9_9EURY|nr:diaminohydroxyphosphoribosylaminopyrimidine reductase (RIB7, arfC) [uncultured marine group II/III euryarchaeote AD1000_99_D12]